MARHCAVCVVQIAGQNAVDKVMECYAGRRLMLTCQHLQSSTPAGRFCSVAFVYTTLVYALLLKRQSTSSISVAGGAAVKT